MEGGEVDRALQALGLDEEEARLYRVLVSRGPSTVGALAPIAELSRTKAYSVLDRMANNGSVVRVADHPRTYIATDPEKLIDSRLELFGSAQTVIRRDLSPQYERQRALSRHLSLAGGAVFRRAEEMLRRAKREIVIVATFVPRELVNRLASLISEVHERGVRVRTVVSEALGDSDTLTKVKGLTDIRVRKVPNAGMIIIDDEEVLIGSLSVPLPDASTGAGDDYSNLQGLWSRDAELVKLHRMLFEDLYSQGVA